MGSSEEVSRVWREVTHWGQVTGFQGRGSSSWQGPQGMWVFLLDLWLVLGDSAGLFSGGLAQGDLPPFLR